MKTVFNYSFCCLFLLKAGFCFSQDPAVDSLLNVLKVAKQDSTKINALNELFLAYEFVDEQKAQLYLDKGFDLAAESGYQKGLANTYILAGYFAEDKGDYPNALKQYFSALHLYDSIHQKEGIAAAYTNIASVYSNQGNYPEALKCLFSCLKIDEALGNEMGLSISYSNIAIIYGEQGDYSESLKNHLSSLEISKKTNDQLGIANSYNNIGNIYNQQKKYDEALNNYLASLKIKRMIDDKKGIGSTCNNISSLYIDLAELEKVPQKRLAKLDQALEYCSMSLEIREEFGDPAGMASIFHNMGVIYTRQKKYVLAEEYLKKSKELSLKIGYKEYLRETYSALSKLDSAKGDFKGAYENHKLYMLYRDSLDNEETRKKTIQSQMTYDFEKKEAVAEAEHKKELENQEALAGEKSRKQTIVIIFVAVGLLLVLIFAGFVFRSLRITKKQKDIIEEQKNVVELQKEAVEQQKTLVEEKQKEIIDSINYARRIQQSLLPTVSYIDKTLKRLNKK